MVRIRTIRPDCQNTSLWRHAGRLCPGREVCRRSRGPSQRRQQRPGGGALCPETRRGRFSDHRLRCQLSRRERRDAATHRQARQPDGRHHGRRGLHPELSRRGSGTHRRFRHLRRWRLYLCHGASRQAHQGRGHATRIPGRSWECPRHNQGRRTQFHPPHRQGLSS